jgi:hypothetical protein
VTLSLADTNLTVIPTRASLDYFDDSGGLPPAPPRAAGGCLLLLRAILDDLFFIADKTPRGGKGSLILQRQLDRDREWVTSNAEVPGSFLWVCTHLGVDAKRVRAEYFARRARRRGQRRAYRRQG